MAAVAAQNSLSEGTGFFFVKFSIKLCYQEISTYREILSVREALAKPLPTLTKSRYLNADWSNVSKVTGLVTGMKAGLMTDIKVDSISGMVSYSSFALV